MKKRNNVTVEVNLESAKNTVFEHALNTNPSARSSVPEAFNNDNRLMLNNYVGSNPADPDTESSKSNYIPATGNFPYITHPANLVTEIRFSFIGRVFAI